MTRKKTSKKLKFCLENMPIMGGKKGRGSMHSPSKFFASHKKVAEALLQSLEENDAQTFLEILDVYLHVNRTKTAKQANLSRTTVQNAFSKSGNPTIRTIAKIVHRAAP